MNGMKDMISNHSRAWSWIPRLVRVFTSILWSTVSKAEDRSKRTMAVTDPESISRKIELETLMRRVSTL